MRVFFANIYRTPAVSWSIAGLQFAAILLLVMVMPQDNVFKTYTSGGQTPEDRVRINVVFIQEAREVEIRDLLQEIGASIVAGPNAAGLYVLEIKKGPAVESSIKKLRQARFVRLAERSLSLRIQPAPVKRTGQRIMAGSAVRSPALGCS